MTDAATATGPRSPVEFARTQSLRKPAPRGGWALAGVAGVLAGIVGTGMAAVAGAAILGDVRVDGPPGVRVGIDPGPVGWIAIALLGVCLGVIAAFRARPPALGLDAQLRYRGSRAGAGYRSRSDPPTWWPGIPMEEARDVSLGPSVSVLGSWLGVGVASVPDSGEADHRCEFVAAGRREAADLPAMAIYSGPMPPHLVALDGRPAVDVGALDLLADWTVKAVDPRRARSALTPPVVQAMNSVEGVAVAVHVDASSVGIWVPSPSEDMDANAVEELQRLLAGALTRRDTRGGRATRDWTAGDAAWQRAMREASVGELRARSRVRARWSLLGDTALVGWLAAMAAAIGLWFVPVALRWPTGGLVVLGWVAVAAPAWLTYRAASARVKAMDARHLRVALQVRDVARAREWPFRRRDSSLETDWTARVFEGTDRLGAMPAAQGDTRWGPAGVAYLEADRRIGPFATSAFTSRVAWARIPGGALRVDFIREDFSQKVAKLLGGSDVIVESHAFNEMWRVKANDPRAAHALLTPRLIETLLALDQRRVTLSVADGRVVLWDDGGDENVDLDARVDALEEFIGCLPAYLRRR